MVVISIDFLVQYFLRLRYTGHILSDACSDESVLKPLIRTFNLALGLRRQGINDLHVTVV